MCRIPDKHLRGGEKKGYEGRFALPDIKKKYYEQLLLAQEGTSRVQQPYAHTYGNLVDAKVEFQTRGERMDF